MTLRSLGVAALVLGGSAPALSAQSRVDFRPMAHANVAVTRMAPTPFGEALTELRIVQPTVIVDASAFGGRLRFGGELNFEALTVPDGELTAGMYGEGFVDRRHPHTTVHELMLSVSDIAGSLDRAGRLGVAVGKGFAPFGTDDPMSRPFLKYPVNHHLAQVLERAVAIIQYDVGPITAEAAIFNGDEPERPGQWPMIRLADGTWRFGDSWSARLTLRPVASAELQGSYARVRSPEHRGGAGGIARKHSVSARWRDVTVRGERYALVEWARTTELDGFFAFHSMLAEGMLKRGRWSGAYRFERTERPEEQRLENPFRTRRPHLENSILGITRWSLHTLRAEWDALPMTQRARLAPFVEATLGRVVKADNGVFDVDATYGSNRVATVSVGLTLGWGDRGHRMGRYGVLAATHDGITHDHAP